MLDGELLTFNAYARDSMNAINNVQVRVIINDINDNSPAFTNLDFTVDINEVKNCQLFQQLPLTYL